MKGKEMIAAGLGLTLLTGADVPKDYVSSTGHPDRAFTDETPACPEKLQFPEGFKPNEDGVLGKDQILQLVELNKLDIKRIWIQETTEDLKYKSTSPKYRNTVTDPLTFEVTVNRDTLDGRKPESAYNRQVVTYMCKESSGSASFLDITSISIINGDVEIEDNKWKSVSHVIVDQLSTLNMYQDLHYVKTESGWVLYKDWKKDQEAK